jgi:hypothetical protein
MQVTTKKNERKLSLFVQDIGIVSRFLFKCSY